MFLGNKNNLFNIYLNNREGDDDVLEIINSFKKYLKEVIPNMVYKSVREADQYETQSSRLKGDEYVGAVLQMDSFLSYSSYSTTVLQQAGINDKDLIEAIHEDTTNIPFQYRDKVVEMKRREIISNYEEENDYYRRLSGYPNVGDSYIYLPPSVLNAYGYFQDKEEDYINDNWDKLTPIHKLPQDILNGMDKSGYLKDLYDDYNEDGYDVRYILHLGFKRISIVTARTAGHYEIIYLPRPENSNRFIRDFSLYYEEARGYFLTQIYNNHFSAEYEFYEGYMGFFILVMTIQRMINSLFEVMIERDFYDNETCRMFLNAYGVPFIDIFTFNQQKTIVKNLNILLKNKCTSQVLYDILSLLEYDNIDITKYLLVKQHKTVAVTDDDEPKPIFIYKTILDEDGNIGYELDKTMIYDYYFYGVDMNEKDINLEEINNASSHRYKPFTENDELWVEDELLITKLQEADINFTETKYTNISITLRMQKIMFEHVYLQKMLCDKANETSRIKVEIPLITTLPVSLFEMEIILICLLCKHNGVEPDLLKEPTDVLSVLGFNFDADLEAIRNEITSNPRIYSQKLVNYINNIRFVTTGDVDNMYRNVRMLADLLIEGMQATASEKVYHAYKKLYLTLMVTDIHNEVFVLPDGTIPDTYMDWLKAYDHVVYEYIESLSVEACVDKINYITTKMTTMFTSTKYLKYLNPIDKTVIEGILRILRWFKSYTLDIRELEVLYLFDSRYYNLMKMINRMYFHANIVLRETNIGYHEWVNNFIATIHKNELDGRLYELITASGIITEKELGMIMTDSMHKLKAKMCVKDSFIGAYIDTVVTSVMNWKIRDKMNQHDKILIIRD